MIEEPETSRARLPKFRLDPAPKVVTFDCYGTLVQWYEVLLREIGATLAKHEARGVKGAKAGKAGKGSRRASASAILDTFSVQSRRLTAERPHRLYKDILRIGFAAAFREYGLGPSVDEIESIAASPMTMGPHPEVPGVLRRLRERYQLAIFTNSDDDLIAPTLARIGVPFDHVITAEQAQAYKPSHRLFEHAYRTMGVEPSETVHVAMGMYWDMKACHELGLRGIWVNRRGETGNPDWLPYTEVSDLDGAASLLLPQ